MAEDAPPLIGYSFFFSDPVEPIANEAAVREASSHLFNRTAHDAAFDHLGGAREAVQRAASMKADRDLPDGNDQDSLVFVEGHDFFL